jgi:hypothetical protein
VFGDTAHDEVPKAGATMSGNNDHVCVHLLGNLDDLGVWCTNDRLARDLDLAVLGLRHHLSQVTASPTCQLFQGLWRLFWGEKPYIGWQLLDDMEQYERRPECLGQFERIGDGLFRRF